MQRPVKTMSIGVMLCFLAVSPVITSGSRNIPGKAENATITIGSSAITTTNTVAVVTKSATQLLEEEAAGYVPVDESSKMGIITQSF